LEDVTREVAGKALDWGSELSLGEQQRLGMARLFYHRFPLTLVASSPFIPSVITENAYFPA
jgi:ABC-type uncharacterized transport system fused permease/ATPase subunit